MRRISSFVIVIGFVAAMPGLALAMECLQDPNGVPDPNEPARKILAVKDVVSGVLSGTRNGHFICDLTNKSGETQECVSITLKKPDGSTLDGPVTCDSVAHGESCTLTRDIKFPSLQEAAYCHAEIPKAFFRGSFRLEDQFENTIAESDMEFDLHGKLKELGEKIDQIPMVTIQHVQNCTFPDAQDVTAGDDRELTVDCPGGTFASGGGCEVFNAGGSAVGFTTYKDSATDASPIPSRWRCQWRNDSGATQNVNFCAEVICLGNVTNVTAP